MNITRPITALAGIALAGATLTGCAGLDAVFEDGPPTDPEGEHFEAYEDAPTSGQMKFAMPSFVPKDAEDIDVHLLPNADPGYLIRYTSGKGILDKDCTPVDEAPEPAITTDWWPEDEMTGAVLECTPKRFTRPVYVTESGEFFYGWVSADDE